MSTFDTNTQPLTLDFNHRSPSLLGNVLTYPSFPSVRSGTGHTIDDSIPNLDFSRGSVFISRPSPAQNDRKVFLKAVKALVASTWIETVALGHEARHTSSLELSSISLALKAIRDASIEVSESLRTTRENLIESALMIPSGAYLAWMEMLASEESE